CQDQSSRQTKTGNNRVGRPLENTDSPLRHASKDEPRATFADDNRMGRVLQRFQNLFFPNSPTTNQIPPTANVALLIPQLCLGWYVGFVLICERHPQFPHTARPAHRNCPTPQFATPRCGIANALPPPPEHRPPSHLNAKPSASAPDARTLASLRLNREPK
ncbi:MAG: hypothetical protein ACF8CQ_08905, partial [Rhodopirellula sp. JB044]|uniref:hypothetical protein n=1 Tax=Rhodopirellula sp. JB044 TaxID=3342844 RepID=UPI00370C893E